MINLDALLSAIQERKRLTEAVLAAPKDRLVLWSGRRVGKTALANFIAANSPAVVLRQVERDLRVLERHALVENRWPDNPRYDSDKCAYCHVEGTDYDDYGSYMDWPCADILDLAHAYAIPTEGGEA